MDVPPRSDVSRRSVVIAGAWSLPVVAAAFAVPASASSALVCPNTSRWYLEYVPGAGYGLDSASYAELVAWCAEAGVPVPSTAAFTYEYVNNGFFWTEGAVVGHSPDPTGVTSIPYDASAGPETRALAFTGGILVGSIPLMDEVQAQVQANIATLTAALPASGGGVWTRQGSNVLGRSTATLAFGDCTATFTQTPPPPQP
ncbi:hypothetical protein J7E45_12415 [Microbacterium sp. ISL-59]|uniref:hypothetical protein n=1 Tax=Microbacterium sp. ISL-59 TaxID=2819159 RepID=UPI001BEBA9FE|nr:hypothetical protein [Microbacterium sp. ISL-59]MBT2496412.1 hypothetical protein [Microbacterium sp. ISL-59]